MELARSGFLNYTVAFKVVRFIAKETHPLVWDAFIEHAKFLSHMLWDSPSAEAWRNWLISVIQSARMLAMQQVRASEISPFERNPNYKRILAVLAEASLNLAPGRDSACYASKYYQQNRWEQPANRELRRAGFVAQLQSNDTAGTFRQLYQVAEQTRLKQVKKQIQYALARTKHFELLVGQLEKIYTQELLPSEFLTLATYCLNDGTHRAFMWDWARDNFDRLSPL